jgi:hypothetical protein
MTTPKQPIQGVLLTQRQTADLIKILQTSKERKAKTLLRYLNMASGANLNTKKANLINALRNQAKASNESDDTQIDENAPVATSGADNGSGFVNAWIYVNLEE